MPHTDTLATSESTESTAAPPRRGLAAGTLVGDRYEIVRLLGEGGMGAVYEARHKILGRSVAIKVLKPEIAHNEQLVARFLQEAKAAAELRHKNIVELTDYGVDGDRPYMVMELLSGEDLAHKLRRDGRMPVPQLVAILDPVLRALATAHERGVIHRDIKPENIFLVRDDEGESTPKIVDFGIAKRQEESVQLTSANMALGTPAYMAPEQIMSSRTVTGAADQYAVGVTMFEALTGRNPFSADTLNAFIVAKATQEPESLAQIRPDLDPAFVAVVHRTLARKPEDRFPTITALREALAPFRDPSRATTGAQPAVTVSATPSAVASVPSQVTPAPAQLTVPVQTPASNGPKFAAIGVVALLAVGGLGWAAFGRSSPAPQTPVAQTPVAAPTPPAVNAGEVLFSIEVEPRSATIRLDGEVIGNGRAEVVRPKDGRRHPLVLEAPGFVTVNEVLSADSDVRIQRALMASQGAPTPAPVAPPTAPSNGRHGSHNAAPTVVPPTAPAQPTVAAPTPAPTPAPPAPTRDPAPSQPDPPRPRTHDPAHPVVDENNPFN